MEESIIKEVLEAQKKYYDSQRDYEQKAETFLKKFLEEHDGMFDMEENEDKFEEVPYVYYQDDGQATECIIKDIYLKGGNIYVDLLGRFHDGSPFEEPFDDVGWDELFHRGDLDDFIAALTDWQDDDEDDEDYDEDDESEDYDEDDEDEDYDEEYEDGSEDDDGGKSKEVKLEATGELNGHSLVDLGLPSGLKWATCNVGASNPEDSGDYFAWGETKPNDNYTKETCTYSDDQATLPFDVDAATANWGEGWRMPTKDEMDELIHICTGEWIERNGRNGYLFTGPNGNSIFFPAAGVRCENEFNKAGAEGNYWSSSLFVGYPRCAWYLCFNSGKYHMDSFSSRYFGNSIRPVCTK